MIKTTINWGKTVVMWLMFSAVVIGSPTSIFAVQYQQCATNSTCSVGEFLYDDEYQPIATSTCTLTSRYSNGDILLNSVTMTPSADGWYSYSIGTSGLSNGIYRGQMCCLTGTENICLDKTFEVSTTLSSIVSDIWASPNRSLTSFGDLITNIWSHPTRQLTSSNLGDGTSLATTENLNTIGSSLATISAQVSAVQTDVVTIDNKIDSLQTQINTIETSTNNILAKWGSYSQADVINYVDTLETQLGNNTQICTDDTVFGHIKCLQDKWGSSSASAIYTAANNAYITSSNLRAEIGYNGKSTTAYDDVVALKAYVDSIQTAIGSTSDTSSTASIFGRIKQVKEAVDAIDNSTLDLNDLLAKWDDLTATDIYDKVKDLSSEISALNTVSNVEYITNNNITQSTDLADLKNQILAMRALLDVNRIQLERLNNRPIIKSWLENGSIIFKSLITNPSSVTQDVPFVYSLPPEVKESDIIKKSDSLTIKYDTSHSVLSVTGDYKLNSKETIVVEIEVKDIWSIPQEKIDSLRKQADELFVPLKGTAYFAQGTTLHSDILASLDKIMAIQKPSKLPEEKIKDYREAQIELESVNKKMDSLKEIVTSAGSIGTLSGFIGGVQTIGVWGIIVVLVAGFIFLAIYIKSVTSKNKPTPIAVSEPVRPNPSYQSKPINLNHRPSHQQSSKNMILLALVFGMSSVSTGVILGYFLLNKPKPVVLSAQDTIKSTTPTITPTTTPEVIPTDTPPLSDITEEIPVSSTSNEPEISASLPTIIPTATPLPTKTIPPVVSNQKRAVVVPSINSYVNVRVSPDRNSAFISKILSGTELIIIAEKYNDLGEKWVKVSQGEISGWILGQLVQYVQNSPEIVSSAKIMINVPAHDIVYIYSKPSYNASITHKISESQTADILLETKMWAKVILSRINVEGWVSQDFIQRNIP